MKRYRHHLLSAAVILGCYCINAAATADNVALSHFSASRLKALGIDPATAAYFSRGGRFPPGIGEVELQVNGHSLGMQKLTFGQDGGLCADEAFFSSAGIRQPAPLKRNGAEADACPALTQAWPTATVSLRPATQEVDVVVPPEAVVKENDLADFQRGGTAALLNYSAYSSQFDSYGRRSSASYLNLESGFNSGDWMVRAAHSLRQGSDSGMAFNTSYIYAQKTLVSRKQLLQAGQINYTSSLLSGAPIDGIQLVPQAALSGGASEALVSGIAHADQSRIEVRQNGILIYSTLVPAGPFTLTEIPLLNSSSDLQLTIITPEGEQEQFAIAAAAYRRLAPQAPETWSLALGRLRNEAASKKAERPWVASLSNGWALSRRVLLEGSTVLASDYLAAGSGMSINPLPELALGLSGALSQDRNHGRQGAKSTASANWSAPLHLGFGADITLYSPGYRELLDSVSTADNPYSRTSAGLSMNWSNELAGSLSLSASQTRQGGSGTDSRRLMAGWSRKFGPVNTSLNWQRQSQNTRDCNGAYHCHTADRDSLFLNLSYTLGGQQISSYYRDTPSSRVTGMRTGNNLTENSSWSMAAERSLKQDRVNNLSGNLNSNLHYATAGLYGSMTENQSRTYSGTLSGGVVAHKEGVLFSPQRVNDTFGVVTVEPAISEVEINTPQGKVWTDWRGKAVVPGLPAYNTGRIELNTERLPENTDVSNGLRQVVAGHGAVTDTHFTLQQNRNGLLTVKLADGTLLPKNSAITTEDGNYVTTAVDSGTVFITDLNDKRSLIARWQEKSCHLNYQVPDKARLGVAYEAVNATCV